MSRIAYVCAGDIPKCKNSSSCQKECGHTTNRMHSMNYKTHEPTEDDLKKYFIVIENGSQNDYMEKIFEERGFE